MILMLFSVADNERNKNLTKTQPMKKAEQIKRHCTEAFHPGSRWQSYSGP